MTWKYSILFAPLALVISGFLLPGLTAWGQDSKSSVISIPGQFLGATAEARDLPIGQPTAFQQVLPLRHQYPVPTGILPSAYYDPALQQVPLPLVSTTNGLNLVGLGNGFPGFTVIAVPPDTNAAVGTTQVVETVNPSFFEVFTKATGAKAGGPFAISSLFSGTGNNCDIGTLMSDPVVKFDQKNSRWVITYLAATAGGPIGASAPFLQCIVVSKSSDALGSYWAYAFDLTSLGGADGALNDYGKLGIWPDAYYMSFNEFDAATGVYDGNSPCAFQSSHMIVGGFANVVCFLPIKSEFTLLPSDRDGANLPAIGEPDFFVGTLNGSSHFNLWKFHVNFTTPSMSSFTGPKVLTTKAYSEACGGGRCIPEPAGGEKLDSLADRMMFRAAYRKFTGTGAHESIVVSHSVVAGTTTGARWYEIRNPNGSTPVIFQQGTFAPADGKFRWLPSVAMDKAGDIAMGYSVSSLTTDPSIRYTGRIPTDAIGTMESEKVIVSGTGVQSSSGNRWGDYSSMAMDPVDDCTFWYTSEYIKSSGSFNWSTRLASFKFTSCH
jgi:hypothetical protein